LYDLALGQVMTIRRRGLFVHADPLVACLLPKVLDECTSDDLLLSEESAYSMRFSFNEASSSNVMSWCLVPLEN
jgi:hypothetical protein